MYGWKLETKRVASELQAHCYTGKGRIFSRFEWPEAPEESVVWVSACPFDVDCFSFSGFPARLIRLLFLPNNVPLFWFSVSPFIFPGRGKRILFRGVCLCVWMCLACICIDLHFREMCKVTLSFLCSSVCFYTTELFYFRAFTGKIIRLRLWGSHSLMMVFHLLSYCS